MASSCAKGGLDWILGKISLLTEWSGVGPGCPGQWGSPHPWRGSKTMWMWHLGTWLSRHGGVGMMVGLDDVRGLFQPTILRYLSPPACSCTEQPTETGCFPLSTRQKRRSFRVGLNINLPVTLQTSGAQLAPRGATPRDLFGSDLFCCNARSSSCPRRSIPTEPNVTPKGVLSERRDKQHPGTTDALAKQEEQRAPPRGHESHGFYVSPLKPDQHFCGLPIEFISCSPV